MKTFQSTPLTFIDQTDSRKLEVYIKSNLPTVQIYNSNTGAYTPDWREGESLILTTDVFLDSRVMTTAEYTETVIKWYRDEVSNNTEIQTNRNLKTLQITTNELGLTPIITYICEATYQGIVSSSRITFTRTDTGRDGTNGAPAPAVQAQYSADGSTGWSVTLNAATHKYIRYSYDGGKTWTTAIKMVGEDGTSVNIKGTATSRKEVSGTSYYTLVYNAATITGATIGDAYLLDGDLYVCVDSRDGSDHFMNVGQIQGPKGNDGNSEYVYIRYSPTANPKDSDIVATPISTTSYIGICVSTLSTAPTTASSYTWSKFVGDNAKNIILSGDSQVFKSSKTTPIAYTPSAIKLTANRINIPTETALAWSYNHNDNKGWTTVKPSSVTISGDTATITGASMTSDSLSVKVSDGTVEDIFTVYRAFDGIDGTQGDSASMAFLTNENVSFSANANGEIPFTSTSTFKTYVVAYNGTTKTTPIIGAIGDLPSGVTAIPNKGTAYSSTIPSVGSLTVTDLYTSTTLTTKVDKTKLANGDSFIVGNYLYVYNATNANFKCQTFVDLTDNIEKPSVYVVGNQILITFTIANKATLGSNASNYGEITIPVISPVDTSLILSWSKINSGATGATGAAGADAYTVLLTNEAHTFAGEVSNAVNGGVAETQILAYKGSTKQSVTISTVNGKAAGIVDTDTGIAGLKFKCDTISGTDVKITFSCTNAFVSPSGTIPIVLTVGGVTFTKMFTYAIAFKGNTGGTGATGATGSPATSYWLVSSASVVQKNASGTIVCTPSTLTFSGKSQTGIASPIDYAGRWIVSYSTDGSTYTTLYTSTSNEVSKTITVATTYKTLKCQLYLAGGTTTLLDEQIIPVVTDGTPGTSASLVNITPSAYFFKSTTGKDGVFTPDYIYLYPRFQTVTYGKWEYSIDGTSWATVTSGSNGLTIGTYNSVANSLQIAKTSVLYTDVITSVSFRCVSSNTAVYDTVSIAKIYDVVDLRIGARNLAEKTNQGTTDWLWSMQTGDYTCEEYIDSNKIKCCKFTKGNTTAQTGWSVIEYKNIGLSKYEPNQTYTISFDILSNVNTVISVRLLQPNGTNDLGSTYTGIKKTVTENVWSKIVYTMTTVSTLPTLVDQCLYINGMSSANGVSYIFKNVKIEKGNTATDWSPAPEDLLNEASNVNAMLSNEAHFFEAAAGGVPKATSIVLDVIGYKGSVRSATTVGTITGIPSAGMTATVSDNGTTNTKLTIAITQALTSDVADYGVLTIPITVNGHIINKTFSWTKAKAGDVGLPGSDAITFQVYSNNGYALSTSVPTIVLQTFAYIGDVEIKAGATYQWYRHNNTDWVAISGATNDYFNVSRDDVSFSNNYMCKMLFNNTEYVGVVTIEDKNDEHRVFASKPSNYFAGDLWVVGNDYIPSGFVVGSMLRATHANVTYVDSDWELATRYDKEIDDLKSKTGEYGPYFSINEDGGLQVDDATINDNTLYIERVETTTINTKEANIEAPLTVSGRYSGSTMLQAPIINLGNFSLVVESNGSLSIIANT